MTKDQLTLRTQEIINTHGKPTWDMSQPVNESARLLVQLRTEYRMEALANKKQAAKAKGQDQKADGIDEIAQLADKENPKYKQAHIGAIGLDESDLKLFTPKEQEILIFYFDNPEESIKNIAKRFGWNYQKMTSFLRSQAVVQLEDRTFTKAIRSRNWKALARAQAAGDSRVIQRLGEHFKQISSEKLELNVVNKPIEDPEVVRVLRELGDKASSTPEPHQTNTNHNDI